MKVLLHIYVRRDSKIRENGTEWSAVGWVPGCRTLDMEDWL